MLRRSVAGLRRHPALEWISPGPTAPPTLAIHIARDYIHHVDKAYAETLRALKLARENQHLDGSISNVMYCLRFFAAKH